MKVSYKITMTLGGILVVCVAALVLVFGALRGADTQLTHLIDTHVPLREASFELEINTIGAGMGVMKYLVQPDPSHRRRVEEDAREFTQFLAEYDRLTSTPQGVRFGQDLREQYSDFLTLGRELMARRDQLTSQLAVFRTLMDEGIGLLDREIALGAGQAALWGPLKAETMEMAWWAGMFVATGNAEDLKNLERVQQRSSRTLAAIGQTDGAGRWLEVERLADQWHTRVEAIVRLRQAQKRDVTRFIELRRQLDRKLDEGLQQLVLEESKAAKADAQFTMHRSILFLVGAFLVLLAVSLLSAGYLQRTFIRPVKRLADGVNALTSGRWDYQVEYSGSDEFAELARGFNRMTVELHANQEDLERRVAERTHELAFLAHHDDLTGLANRNGLGQQLEYAIKLARRSGERIALLLMDLDSFKHVNDSLGHEQGDRMLREIGRRLKQQVREVDVAARVGGDEFCLLLNGGADHRDAAEVAERCLLALAEPIDLSGVRVTPRASIGIAMYPDDAMDSKGLKKASDVAMYAAKQAGGQRFAFYVAGMTHEAERRLSMESALRSAFERDEFEMHYQPQVELETGRLHGVEALIRWRSAERGLVYPAEFIPLAEQFGLADVLGEWVLNKACRQAVAWHRDGMPDLVMAVNISPIHFESPGFVDTVGEVLRDTGLDPGSLEIEVTESVTRNAPLHAHVSSALRDLGVRVAIDDFGAGYSSLTVLKHMPIDTLKLDRQFVAQMVEDPRSSLLVGTITGMANGLGFALVAEGVETQQQMQILMALGCPLAQGYFFSPPITAGAFPELALRDYRYITAAGGSAGDGLLLEAGQR